MRFLRTLSRSLGIGAFLCLSVFAEDDYDRARVLLNEAFAAHGAEDFGTLLEKASAAVAIRPDHTRFQSTMAAAHALNGDAHAAAAVLHEIASWGIYLGASGSPAFDRVRDDSRSR